MLCLKTKTKKFAVLTFHFDFELLLVWVFEPGFHKTVFEDPEMTLPLTVWLFWLGVGVWVLGDGPFIERQWYGVTDVTHIWTTLWGQRLFCFFFFMSHFLFPLIQMYSALSLSWTQLVETQSQPSPTWKIMMRFWLEAEYLKALLSSPMSVPAV